VQIVDEDGADGLSMRTLARRLDSGTATLYRHFSNRAALIARVIDEVFGDVEFDVEGLAGLDWRQACEAAAQGMFDALSRHRKIAALLVEHMPMGPKAMALRERCLAVLLDNGFPPRLAAQAYATLARYVLGFAIQFNGPDDVQTAEDFRAVDPSAFAATAKAAEWLPVPIEQEFAFGLQLIIAGLADLRANQVS
jgi:TetR/AcrR family transcriptional regulator, tetracycline repressor protein